MPIFNQHKWRNLLSDIPEVPDKYATKKKRPRELAVILEANCTGCEVCVPFCPVDCIEKESVARWPDRTIPPVRVRFDECIGCRICVKVCEKLAWDAIEMQPTEDVEKRLGIQISER
jgi:electron transport complex protein RnfB